MAITYRADVGRPLTNAEVDANFAQLANGSIEGFLQNSGTARSWISKAREIVSVKDFGAVGSGSVDDTTAINLAIAYLNAAAFRSLYFPQGNYAITGALTTIQQSGVTVYGDGIDVARITVSASSTPSTLGTIFTVGNDSASAIARVTIKGLGINYGNTPDPAANPFVLKNCADVKVDNIYLNGASGLTTIGSSSATVSRAKFTNIEGNYNKGAAQGGYKVIELSRAISCSFSNVFLTGSSPTGTGYSVYIAPPSTGFVDEIRFIDCTIWADGQSHGVYLDFTNEKIVNVWFDRGVFDSNATASFTLNSSSGAKECRNITVSRTRLEADAGASDANCVTVSHAGTGVMSGIIFDDCLLAYKENKAAVVSGTIKDINFIRCRVQDSSGTEKSAALSFACGNFSVEGCRFYTFSGTGNTVSAVETTDDVDNFTVTGNRAAEITGAFMTHDTYAAYSMNRIVRENVGGTDTRPNMVETFTVLTLPAAANYTRGVIYVSDETGGATLAFSDGTDWRRVQDRAVVS